MTTESGGTPRQSARAVLSESYVRLMQTWPTRKHSLGLMWRHRRGIGCIRGAAREFAVDMLLLRRKEMGMWAVSFRAWEPGPKRPCPDPARADASRIDLNRSCPVHGIPPGDYAANLRARRAHTTRHVRRSFRETPRRTRPRDLGSAAELRRRGTPEHRIGPVPGESEEQPGFDRAFVDELITREIELEEIIIRIRIRLHHVHHLAVDHGMSRRRLIEELETVLKGPEYMDPR